MRIDFDEDFKLILKSLISQAVEQMEERLQQFIDRNMRLDSEELESDGTARFIHHQIIELARDCLQKSQDKMISSAYFYELSEHMERLLVDVSQISVNLPITEGSIAK